MAGRDLELEVLRQEIQALERELLEAREATSDAPLSQAPSPDGGPLGDPEEGPGEDAGGEPPPIRTSPPTEPSPGGTGGDATGLRAEVQELEEDLAAARERAQGLEVKLEGAVTEIETLQTENQELLDRVDRLTAENQELRGEVEALIVENRGLRATVDQLTGENSVLLEEVVVLRELRDQVATVWSLLPDVVGQLGNVVEPSRETQELRNRLIRIQELLSWGNVIE